MDQIAVSSAALAIRADKPLTPAMLSALWEISASLDEERVPPTVPNSVWLSIPTARLRGPGARQDNVWLRECLERMTGLKLSGQHRGNEWGAVLVAEWHLTEGGSKVRVLIPPAGVHALRSSENFAKIETTAAHRLPQHARRLYGLLADRKRQTDKPYGQWSVDNLRGLLGVDDKKSYDVWGAFRRTVLDPAIEAINDFGTVRVKMTPVKSGRSIAAVRFDWKWKDPHEATEIVAENKRHSTARKKGQASADAPPMIVDAPQPTDALTWWHGLTDAEREGWKDKVGRMADVGRGPEPRPDRVIAGFALERHKAGEML
jgi:hypothetical protein